MTTDKVIAGALAAHLQPVAPMRLYAIVDAGVNQGALDFLYAQDSLSFDCLLAGEVDPDVFEVAPFLVDLADQPETLSWLCEGFGQGWISFVHSQADLDGLQAHLRQFTQARLPDGRVVWFRFHDPRVMRVALPAFDQAQAQDVFREVALFMCEGAEPGTLTRLGFDGARVLASTSRVA